MANSDLTVQIKTTSDNAGVDKVRQGIQSIGDEARSSDGKASGFISTLESMGKNLIGIGVAFAGYQIVQQIEDMGSAVFSAAGQLEQTNMSYQSLLGNVSQANALFADLTKYANTTPFTSLQINDAAKQLLAFGQTGDQVVSTVKQLGDVTSAGGGDLQALSLVTGQIFAQGKLRAQDMYQVINDGGAGLIHIMAENAGGMQKLTDEFNSGGIPAQQYFDAINKATDKGGFAFQGAQKQALTFNGMISTLTDSATQFGEKLIGVHIDPSLGLVIDKGGLFDRAKGVINDLTNSFNTLGGKAQGVEKQIGDYLGPSFDRLFKMLNDHKQDIKDIVKVVGESFVGAFKLLLDVLTLVTPYILEFGEWCTKHKTVVMDIAVAIGAIALALKMQAAITAFQTAFTLAMGLAAGDTGVAMVRMAVGFLGTDLITFGGWGVFALAAVAAFQIVDGWINKLQSQVDVLNGKLANNQKAVNAAQAKYDASAKTAADKKAYTDALAKDAASNKSIGNQASGIANTSFWSWLQTPAFATGGYTGSGGVNDVAGIVHKGEYVLPQSAVNQSTGQPKLGMSGVTVTNHIYNQVDYDKGIMQLGFMLRTR